MAFPSLVVSRFSFYTASSLPFPLLGFPPLLFILKSGAPEIKDVLGIGREV